MILSAEAQIEEMEMGKLLCSMKTVIGAFWRKHSKLYIGFSSLLSYSFT